MPNSGAKRLMVRNYPRTLRYTVHFVYSAIWRPTPALWVGPITEDSERLASVHTVWLSLHQLYRLSQCGCHCLHYAYWVRYTQKLLKRPSPCVTMEVPRLWLRTLRLTLPGCDVEWMVSGVSEGAESLLRSQPVLS